MSNDKNIVSREQFTNLTNVDPFIFADTVFDDDSVKELKDSNKAAKKLAEIIDGYFNDMTSTESLYVCRFISLATIHCKNAYTKNAVKDVILNAIKNEVPTRKVIKVIKALYMIYRDIPLKYENLISVSINEGTFYCVDVRVKGVKLDTTEIDKLAAMSNNDFLIASKNYTYTQTYDIIKALFKADADFKYDDMREKARLLYSKYFGDSELLVLPKEPVYIKDAGRYVYIITSTDAKYRKKFINKVIEMFKQLGYVVKKCVKAVWEGAKKAGKAVWNGIEKAGEIGWNGIKRVGGFIYSLFNKKENKNINCSLVYGY